MARSILVENGIVTNIAVGVPSGYIEIPVEEVVDVGWEYLDGVIIAPPPPTDEEIRAAMPTLTSRQFRLGLINAGITLQEVDDQIALIVDPSEKAVAQIEWAHASTFERVHPLVVSISPALGLTPEMVDSMWLWAAET